MEGLVSSPTMMAVVIGLSSWGFVRAWRSGASRTARVANVLPLALMPVATAVTAGSWVTRWELHQIAETGSGGMEHVARVFLTWTDPTLMGLLLGVAVLAVAAFPGSRQGRGGVLEPRLARSLNRTTRVVLAGLMVASVTGVAVAVRALEIVVIVFTMPAWTGVADPAANLPSRVWALVPRVPGEHIDLAGRALEAVNWGGLGLLALLVALALATRGADWGASGRSRATALGHVGIVGLAGMSALGIVRLWSMAGWLREIVQRA